MKKMFFAFLMFIVSSFQVTAQSIDDDMKIFFKVSGTEATYKNVIPMMLNNFKGNPAFSTIPDEFWTDFEKEAQESYKDLENQISEVYKKHFTSAEIKQLIAFYESPIGQKLVEKQPLVLTDSYQIGSEWGRKLGEKVALKIQEKKN
jgi:uncharacterized protein